MTQKPAPGSGRDSRKPDHRAHRGEPAHIRRAARPVHAGASRATYEMLSRQAYAQSLQSAQGAPSSRHGARPRSRRASRDAHAAAVVALLLFAAIVGGGVFLWLNRSVSISVNGTRTSVRAGSTLADIFAEQDLEVAPGNLLSVGGSVITEGGGEPFSVSVGGRDLSAEQVEAFRAEGNETVVFGNGADVTEASHDEVREVRPQLEPYGRIGAVSYVQQYGSVGRQHFTVGDVSGEAVPGEEIKPVQNVVIGSVNPSPDDGSKVIALTFDDGPSSYTQGILDILDRYGARATFFCLGTSVARHPELVQAIERQGSQVASHTQSHEQLTALGADDLRAEITDGFSAISSAGGRSTTVMRPPYGSFDNETWLASGGDLSVSVIWTIDSNDWRLPGTDAIVSTCVNNAYSGAVVLLHDGGGNREQTVAALPCIIEKLQEQGYRFVTISELMSMDSRIPESVASGNASIPEGCTWATEMAG